MRSDPCLAPHEGCAVAALREASHAWPDRVAVEFGPSFWTYRTLLDDASGVGAALRSDGNQHSLIALRGAPSYDLVACLLGTWIAGSTPILVDASSPLEHRRRLEAIADEVHPVTELFENASGIRDSDGFFEPQTIGDDSPAYVVSTSGTSGRPKFVVASHAGLRSFMRWESRALEAGPMDRVGLLTSLSFDVVFRDILLPLLSGGTLVIPENRSMRTAGAVLDWLRRNRITILHAVPSLTRRWMSRAAGLNDGIPSLRATCFAGEPLDASTCRDWTAMTGTANELWNFYGPTETTLAKFASRVRIDSTRDAIAVGRPIDDCRVEIIGEDERPLPADTVGEVAIITPHQTTRYEGSLARTWSERGELPTRYMTGDFGFTDASGALTLLGRRDDQVKIDGVRIDPAHVSAAVTETVRSIFGVAAHTRVFPAADRGQPALACAIDARPDTIDVCRLRSALVSRLAAPLLPRWIAVMDGLPVTPNGKLDRDEVLRRSHRDEPDTMDIPSDLLRAVLDATAAVSGTPDPGPHDDVFSLGMDSLDAEEMAMALVEATGVEVEACDLQTHRTPARIAAAIADRPSGKPFKPAERGDADHVTPQQRRFRAFYMGSHDRSWCNVQLAVTLDPACSTARVRTALERVTRRHTVLRCVFTEDDAGELIVVHDALGRIELGERSIVGADGRQGAIDDLRAGSLDPRVKPWRADRLIGESEDTLLLTLHHLVADGRTKEILAGELATALSGGHPGPEPTQLWMVAAHEKARERAAEDRFLKTMLEELSEDESLGIESKGDYRMGTESVRIGLSTRLVSDLRQAAMTRNTTPFSVMLTHFAQATAMIARKSRLRVLVPANGRTHATASVAGNLHNLVPVSVSAGDSVDRVQRKLITGLERQCVQLDTVADALGICPHTDPHPISSVIFNAAQGDPGATPGLGLTPRHDVSPHEIRHQIAGSWTTGPACELRIDYRPGVIDSQCAHDLLDEQVSRLEEFASRS